MLKEAQLVPYVDSLIPKENNILVLAPHPDDEVFGCGGAIALHLQSGCHVKVILVTSGELGGDGPVRIAESQNASVLLGSYALECWHYPDREVHLSNQFVDKIIQTIIQNSISLVYAPSLWENHPDHRAVALSAVEAVRQIKSCALMQYEVSAPLRPNRLIDITSVVENKLAAMQCFSSQLKNQRYDQHISSLNQYRSYTLNSSVKSAEAYEYYSSQDLKLGSMAFFQSEFERQKKLGLTDIFKEQPLVSVLIRSMDKASLQKALFSVASQSYSNIEIVVVNATGRSHQKLEEKINSVTVKFIDSDMPLYRAGAANRALEELSGQYALFLDDDDWISSTHIQKLVDVLEKDLSIVLAYTATSVIDETGNEIGLFCFDYQKEQIYASNFIPIHSALFRTDMYTKRHCKFDENFAIYEDWDFWIQISAYGNFKYIPGVSAYYTMENGGSSDAHNLVLSRDARAKIFNKWKPILDTNAIVFLADEAVKSRELVSLKKEKADLQTEIDLILNSNSWKLAQKFRKVKQLIGNKPFIHKRIFNKIKLLYIDLVRQMETGSEKNGNILNTTPFLSSTKTTLCLFSHYDRDGIIDPYVIYYLESLLALGCDIVFVSTASLAQSQINKIDKLCVKVIAKENIGYDFGAWKTAIQECQPQWKNYKELILCNDSVYAPLLNLKNMFDIMNKKNLDMWGVLDSLDMGYHIQSYFLVFNEKVMHDKNFLLFWESYRVYRYKRNIIENYEVGLSQFMLRQGYKIASYCQSPRDRGSSFNASHFMWDKLIIDQKCPIIKIELLRDNPMNVNLSNVKSIISDKTSYPFELIENHLKRASGSNGLGLLKYL